MKKRCENEDVNILGNSLRNLARSYSNIISLKNWLVDQIYKCDCCIETLIKDLQQLPSRRCGKTYLNGELLKNQVAKETFKMVLAKIEELEVANDSKRNVY